jgi:hypothetical protein
MNQTTEKRPQRNERKPNQGGRPNRNRRNRNHKKKTQGNSRWNRHRLSEHFVKRDFDSRKKECSCSLRISLGLVGIIEALRAKLNKRIDILTGFYCGDCRPREYGIKRNHHHSGVAADIRVEGMDVVDLFLEAETYPEIKGLGINFDEPHIHIDTRKDDDRQMWAEKDGEWILITDDNRATYLPTPTQESDTPPQMGTEPEADNASATD